MNTNQSRIKNVQAQIGSTVGKRIVSLLAQLPPHGSTYYDNKPDHLDDGKSLAFCLR